MEMEMGRQAGLHHASPDPAIWNTRKVSGILEPEYVESKRRKSV